jgi:hypothetical protein
VANVFARTNVDMSDPRQSMSGSVDIAAAAHELFVSEKFIRRRIADGSLKAFRLKGSRVIRIDRAELAKLKVPV